MLTREAIVSATVNHRMKLMLISMLRDFRGDIKVPFDFPNAPSCCNLTIPSIHQHHEQRKKREYDDCIWEVEKASFTPSSFVTTGGIGKEATIFYC